LCNNIFFEKVILQLINGVARLKTPNFILRKVFVGNYRMKINDIPRK